MTTVETVSGRVEARNERGIRVAGEWRNLSKFKPLELPTVGATVELGLDPKGFINTLQVVSATNDHGIKVTQCNFDRDRQIARLAVLKAAASFGASRPDCKSADVLAIADRWLEWIES